MFIESAFGVIHKSLSRKQMKNLSPLARKVLNRKKGSRTTLDSLASSKYTKYTQVQGTHTPNVTPSRGMVTD